MDKYEFLKLCSEYGRITKEMQIDYGESIIDTYNSLVENGEITQFHGFVCMVSDKVRENTYVLIPYTGIAGRFSIYRISLLESDS